MTKTYYIKTLRRSELVLPLLMTSYSWAPGSLTRNGWSVK